MESRNVRDDEAVVAEPDDAGDGFERGEPDESPILGRPLEILFTKEDLPAFGNPAGPTSAISLSSRWSSRRSPFCPRGRRFRRLEGGRRGELPSPPRPPRGPRPTLPGVHEVRENVNRHLTSVPPGNVDEQVFGGCSGAVACSAVFAIPHATWLVLPSRGGRDTARSRGGLRFRRDRHRRRPDRRGNELFPAKTAQPLPPLPE